MLDKKASLRNFKKIEVIASIFFDPNDMKLEINSKREIG